MTATQPAPDVAQLVAEHYQTVYRYAYRLTGSQHDAEDLTQKVFLIAQQKMSHLRKMGSARGWLCAILRNCFVKEQQRRRPVPSVDLDLNIDSIPADPPAVEIDREGLQEALNRLPEALRLVVVMFYYEDLSYRQIAEQLGVPIGTVMSRLARAKGYLRASMLAAERPVRKRRPGVAVERG